MERPAPSESPEHMHQYIDQVPEGDIRDILESQATATLDYLRSIPDERSLERYAPGKWTVREVLGHINDTERVFTFRAWWFARSLEGSLPGFDQEVAVPAAGSDAVTWDRHIAEFAAVRASTLALFRNLPGEAWTRHGVASGRDVSVNALAYITAGHVEHHLRILREQYRL